MNEYRITFLKDIFGISENSPFEQDLLDRQNVVIGLIIAIFHVITLGIMLIGSFFNEDIMLAHATSTNNLLAMRYIYGVFIFLSVVYCYYGHRFFIDGITDHKFVVLEVYAYIIECLGFGLSIGFWDYRGITGMLLLSTELILCFAVFTIKPWSVAIIGTLTYVGYLSLSINSNVKSSLNLRLTFLFILLVSLVLSIVRYQESLRMAVRQEQLMDMNNNLVHISDHDYMTGLRNRHALHKEIRQYVRKPVYVLLTGIDDFTFFNDLYGHPSGDELMKIAAKKLEECFAGDRCYLYGDDLFLVIGTEKERSEFQRKLAAWISFHEAMIDDLKVHFTVSGGYVFGEADKKKVLLDMLRQADVRLNHLRHEGKGVSKGYAYDPKMNPREILLMDLDSTENGKTSDLDVLTGLPGMMYFSNKAEIVLNNFSGDDDRYAFLYMNVIGMQSYNEANGYRAGDDLLRMIANALLDSFPHQLVSRFGEDHFVVLAELQDIQLKLNRLFSHIGEVAGGNMNTLKAGIYVYEQGNEVDLCCDRARMACNSIHDTYDVSCAFFEERMESRQKKMLFFLNNLESAIEGGKIYPHYQPIVDTKTGRVSSAEALVRWNDPVYGLVSPIEYIPVLEHFNVISKLDIAMVRHVVQDLLDMMEEGVPLVPISINLSRIDFVSCDIVSIADEIIKEAGIPSHLIHFEVTETGRAKDEVFVKKGVYRLRELGYEVWMDDFGSGYSSLNVLKDYQFDVIKIDLMFMRGYKEADDRTARILRSVINMANALHMKTLAEGIEREDQYEFLQDIGCEFSQGYLFSRPIPLRDLKDYLKLHLPEQGTE